MAAAELWIEKYTFFFYIYLQTPFQPTEEKRNPCHRRRRFFFIVSGNNFRIIFLLNNTSSQRSLRIKNIVNWNETTNSNQSVELTTFSGENAASHVIKVFIFVQCTQWRSFFFFLFSPLFVSFSTITSATVAYVALV